MAALTWYVTNVVVGGTHQELSETSPGSDATSSPNYGWLVNNAGGTPRYGSAQASTKLNNLSTTPQPDGSIVTTVNAGDCWRSKKPYTGSFATGNWAFHGAVIAVLGATGQDGLVGFRLFRSVNADGSGATELSGGSTLAGGQITNLSTSQTLSSHSSTSITGFPLTDEYLFVQVGWEHNGNGTSMSSPDVVFRIGTTASRVISTEFTPTDGRQGPNNPATGASSSPGDIAWSSPSLVGQSDDQKAGAAFTATLDQATEVLRATDYGFSIPSGATILGIKASIERSVLVASAIQDLTVQLVKGGTAQGDDNAAAGVNWPTTEAYRDYGGADQLWGLSWSDTDINASNFGVQLRATNTDGTAVNALVDHMRITVFFNTNTITTKTQTGAARVTAQTPQTQSGTARVAATTDQTQPGTARVALQTTQDQSGVARVTAQADRTQGGTARITAQTTQDQSGAARVTATATQTQAGVARVTAQATQDQSGVARITAQATRTQDGVANILVAGTTTQTQSGVASILRQTTQTQAGVARIGLQTTKTQTGAARVTAQTTQGQAGTASVRATTTQTQQGVAAIGVQATQTQTGTARIAGTTSQTQAGVARIGRQATQTQAGVANLSVAGQTIRSQSGQARIAGTATRTQSGRAWIAGFAPGPTRDVLGPYTWDRILSVWRYWGKRRTRP